jgi:hypothetical protein
MNVSFRLTFAANPFPGYRRRLWNPVDSLGEIAPGMVRQPQFAWPNNKGNGQSRNVRNSPAFRSASIPIVTRGRGNAEPIPDSRPATPSGQRGRTQTEHHETRGFWDDIGIEGEGS